MYRCHSIKYIFTRFITCRFVHILYLCTISKTQINKKKTWITKLVIISSIIIFFVYNNYYTFLFFQIVYTK